MNNTVERYGLRPARKEEIGIIRAMVRRARLNPFGLDYRCFTVAVDAADQIIGCVQRKFHRDGSQELTSLVVAPEWRRQGVGSKLIQHVKAEAERPLWLICLVRLTPYYQQFGFVQENDLRVLPPYFRFIHYLDRVISGLTRREAFIVTMVWR